MASNYITIEIGEKHTRVIDADIKKEKLTLQSAGYDLTSKDYFTATSSVVIEAQAKLIQTLISNLKIKKTDVGLIIPDGQTYSQIIEMPKLNEKELLSAIRYQADQFVPMPIEKVSLDIEILKEDPETRKLLILIVAAPKTLVNKIEKTASTADLNPIFLKNELSAFINFPSQFIKSDDKDDTLIVNLGYHNSSLYLLRGSDHLIVNNRTFQFGINIFIRDLMVNLNVDEDKAFSLLKEIGFDYTASVNLQPLVEPLAKELTVQIEKGVMLAKNNYSINIKKVLIYNYDSYIKGIVDKVGQTLNLSTFSLNLNQNIVNNQIKVAFETELSSFISNIGGQI
ncbi:hypothetical protein COZ39_04145 [Candidatus Roizmanbacteria bacterium CG_4_10_14_3_um_filter_33_21]|uniref:SHS2 domain-containing protein n=5 Tax=Candidatus Roizmaniibacteriota TaxID=1752723 RepID=A0A2M7E554_9BACT|nr:MAG: hypothetical protein COW96_00300 [Candidatus Roizmanbacteria bacterium CG22_combo_CG10-13_8_21_14_all_33_16]PIV62854.1 MAG: hypothetical protein COS12_00850 [Candidatus Roizmanbacteria bacterium CG01_land_8_20_14_3_00_33_9]PIX70945.1 MAG: hypothetical protein COZ39_04145 [Candidatus Roizmanbacteria bacterium CG_4_10_14_3_um_filter_33_21]